MTKEEYHQLCITNTPILIEGYRAEIKMIEATLLFYKDDPRINTDKYLDHCNNLNKRIQGYSNAFRNHENELTQIGIDPLDHLQFTEEDKTYLDQFLVKISKRKRIVNWIYRLFGR